MTETVQIQSKSLKSSINSISNQLDLFASVYKTITDYIQEILILFCLQLGK